MRKLKTIIPVVGILLLILSAASLYVAMQALSDIRPAEDYEDIGVLTFQPYDVLPVQVQNTGASSRDRRMNPTKTVCMVYYRATDGSGYKWSDEALTRDLGKDIVEAGETVERRVLSIPSDGTYITVEPEQTAGSYTEGLQGKYTRIIGLSTLYTLFYLIALILVKLVSRLRKNWAANQEVERAAVPRNVSAASQLGPEIEEPRRFRPPEKWSGWRQEPGGLEVRKPPRIHPRIKLCLFLLAAVFLLAVFQRLGSSDPVDLDYGWNGNTWICDELGLRFDLPAGGVIYDSEEQQKAREEKFGRRGSAGQVLLTVIDPGEGSNLELLVVRTDLPTEDFLLKMATLYAENAAGEGSFELEAREDLTAQEFAQLGTRALTLNPETRTANAIGDRCGAIDAMPKRAVTIGIKQILGARKVRLGVFREWHRSVVRQAAYGEVTAHFPASLLQSHPDAVIYTNAVAAGQPF